MAKATKREKVIQVIQEEGYSLDLSAAEASALLWVLSRVGGNPDRTPRGLISKITFELEKAGAVELEWESAPSSPRTYFADPPSNNKKKKYDYE